MLLRDPIPMLLPAPSSHPTPPFSTPPPHLHPPACSDTPKQIKSKVNKYAFSGGGATVEEHREKGERRLPPLPAATVRPAARCPSGTCPAAPACPHSCVSPRCTAPWPTLHFHPRHMHSYHAFVFLPPTYLPLHIFDWHPFALPAGANLDVDVSWKWLNFFMEDDARLAQVQWAVLPVLQAACWCRRVPSPSCSPAWCSPSLPCRALGPTLARGMVKAEVVSIHQSEVPPPSLCPCLSLSFRAADRGRLRRGAHADWGRQG
jgi:hypothetical protein